MRYRVDFYWPEFDVVGECDGRVKYGNATDLWNEKRREDAIRPLVRRFVRWSWSDALQVTPLAALLARAGLPIRPGPPRDTPGLQQMRRCGKLF